MLPRDGFMVCPSLSEDKFEQDADLLLHSFDQQSPSKIRQKLANLIFHLNHLRPQGLRFNCSQYVNNRIHPWLVSSRLICILSYITNIFNHRRVCVCAEQPTGLLRDMSCVLCFVHSRLV